MNLLSSLSYKRMNAQLQKKFASGEYSAPAETEPIIVDEKAKCTFAVWGDSQVSNYMFARECSFKTGVMDIAAAGGTLDALVICGDIAENGLQSEYLLTADMLNSISGKVKRFVAMPGNHDVRLRPFKAQQHRFVRFLLGIKNAAYPDGEKYNHALDVGSCRFIVMGTDCSTFEGAYISKAQLNWLENELENAKTNGKVAFVFNHQPLKRTNGLPNSWIGKGKWRGSVGLQSDALKAVLTRFPGTFYVTGHLHGGTGEYSYECVDGVHLLSAQTISAGNHGAYSLDAQGYLITVYPDRIVLRARIFGQGRFVEKKIPNSEIIIPINK